MELVRRIQNNKADKSEFQHQENLFFDLQNKIKHLSVYASELCKIILPEKTSGKFVNQSELQCSIRKREELIEEGKLMNKWILSTTVGEESRCIQSKMPMKIDGFKGLDFSLHSRINNNNTSLN